MNNNQPSHRSSIICRAVRRWESVFGNEAELTRITERHLEVCDECQAFFAEDLAFEDMMRGSARTEKRAGVAMPSANFEQAILRAVRESGPDVEREPRRSKSWSLGLSLAGAAAGVALAVVLSQNASRQPAGPEFANGRELGTTGVSADGGEVAEAASSAMRWWGSLDARESALELAAKNPLQQEIDSISTDAQSVLGFLALNFLPSDAAAVKKTAGDASQG